MKKALKRILRIVIILLALAALGFLLLLLMAGNHQYVLPLRSDARQADGYVNSTLQTVMTAEGRQVQLPSGYVLFSPERQVIEAVGVTPIRLSRTLWGTWTYEDFIARYGEPHCDIGHNVFWPAWVTDDGYLMSMWCGGERYWPLSIGNMGEVWMYDLLGETE